MLKCIGFAFIISLIFLNINTTATNIETTNIVFVGDSITEGSIGSSYLTKLRELPKPWGSENVSLINSGTNGYRMSYFYNNEANVIEKIFDRNAHYVVIFLGLNDISSSDSSSFNIHYRYLIDKIDEIDVDQQIEQIFLIKFSYSNAVNEMIALEYLDVIGNISEDYNLPLLDLWNATYLQWDYFYDHAHLNELGAQFVAEEIDYAFGNMIDPIVRMNIGDESDSPGNIVLGLMGILFLSIVKKNHPPLRA